MNVVRRFTPLALLLGAAVLVGLVVAGLTALVLAPLDGCNPHLALQFLGHASCDGASLDDLKESLTRDCGFAMIYGAALTAAAIALPRQTHTDARLDPLNTIALFGPGMAAVADIAENFLLGSATTLTEGAFSVEGPIAANAVTALAILKWTLLAVVVAVLLLRIANRSPDRRPVAPPEQTSEVPAKPSQELALCCSGGGIRSAAFSLGVLFELDKAKITDTVARMAAVSGGNYAATGWCLAKADGSGSPAESVLRQLLDDEHLFADDDPRVESVSPGESAERRRDAVGKHRYLANGPGGIPRAVVWAGLAVAANVVQLVAVLVVAGWPLGKLLTTDPLYPKLAQVLDGGGTFAAAEHDWQPIAYLAGAGVALALVSAAPPQKVRRALLAGAGGLLGLAALYVVVLAVFPWLLVQAYGAENERAFYVGGISLITVVGALLRLFRDPLRRVAPRLGGVALGVLVLALLGLVVHDSVVADGPFSSTSVWIASVVACLLFAYGIDTQTWSVRELYRATLTNSFAPRACRPKSMIWRIGRKRATRPIGFTWKQLREAKRIPELHVCCAASRVGLQPNGSTAEAFSISQKFVRHYRASGTVTVPTGNYVRSLNSLALEMLRTPAGWLSTSGAAFASAMGRASLGSTNALLAAANVDLGVWLPTPAAVCEGDAVRRHFPPVGLGRLSNEIFGLYSDRDEMIFVSDGGHVENLGLVELLRNGARRIVCIDASGDEPGSFATLHAALRHADVVLPDTPRLQFDTSRLRSSSTPPPTSVYEIGIYQPERVGTIYYAKLQAARDQSLNLRQFANSDPRFPNYSTANQLLDDQQFAFLVLAGRQAGRGLAKLLEGAA